MSLIQGRVDNIKKKKGQALVEIALVLPILALLLCGVIDFGRILYAAATLNIVSQEAVRYAGLAKDETTAETNVETYVVNHCPLDDINADDIDITYSGGIRKSGGYVTVSLEYEVNYITPIRGIIGSSFTINSQSTIRVE